MVEASSATAPLRLRTRLDSEFSFRNEKEETLHEQDSIHLAVSKEDWHNVSMTMVKLYWNGMESNRHW